LFCGNGVGSGQTNDALNVARRMENTDEAMPSIAQSQAAEGRIPTGNGRGQTSPATSHASRSASAVACFLDKAFPDHGANSCSSVSPSLYG
jgi:hypothetical protein